MGTVGSEDHEFPSGFTGVAVASGGGSGLWQAVYTPLAVPDGG